MSKNEQLIQNGFELIVRAFDEMDMDCQSKLSQLEKKITALQKENTELREDNKFLLCENRRLEKIISNLTYNLDSAKKKLDIINKTNNESNITGGRINTVSSIHTNNNNQNSSEYYMNTVTTLPLETDNEEECSSDMNCVQQEIKQKNCNYVQQLKTTHFRNNSLNYPGSARERCVTSIGKEMLTSNAKEINNFLMKCKEVVTANIFEKMLLLFNNHKTGLISTHDLVKRIREFIVNNKYLMNIFNQLIIIN